MTRSCVSSRLRLLTVAALIVSLPAVAAGLEWSQEELVGGDDNDDDWNPRVEITPDGRVWVVWMGFDPVDSDEEVYYSTNDGTGWSQRALVHEENTSHDRFPVISVSEDGIPWVIWQRFSGGQYTLLAAHWAGAGWSQSEVVRDEGDRYDLEALLAINSQDVWIATDAYVDTLPDRTILTYHWDGSTWNGPWGVGATDALNTGPDLALAPDGTPWMVWSSHVDWPSGPDHVKCSRFEGNAWTAPETVDSTPGAVSWSRIVFDQAGTPLAFWVGNGDEGPSTDVEYSRFVAGGWTSEEPLSEPDGYYATDGAPACDVGPDGQIWVVWGYGYALDFLTGDIAASSWTGDGWTTEEAVCETTGRKEDTYPDVCVAPDGSVWTAWMSYVDLPPYDYAILASHGTATTAVDFCCLEAAADGGETRLSWYATGEVSGGPFVIWRMRDGGDRPSALSHPPDGAEEVDTEGVQGSPDWQVIDPSVTPGRAYLYWVECERLGSSLYLGPARVSVPPDVSDTEARILFSYPNPSAASLCVAFELAVAGEVELEVFDATGRLVNKLSGGQRSPGRYELPEELLCWEGTSGSGNPVSSGVYFARLLLDGRRIERQTAAVTIVK